MKKHIILLSALLLTASAMSGCYDYHIHDPKPESSEMTAKNLIEIDPFAGIETTYCHGKGGLPEEKNKNFRFHDVEDIEIDGAERTIQIMSNSNAEGLKKCRDYGCKLEIYREPLPNDLKDGDRITLRVFLKTDFAENTEMDLDSYLAHDYGIKLTETSKDLVVHFEDADIKKIDPFRDCKVYFSWFNNKFDIYPDFNKSPLHNERDLRDKEFQYVMSLEEGEDPERLYIGDKIKYQLKMTAGGKEYVGEEINKYLEDNWIDVRLRRTEKIFTVSPKPDSYMYSSSVNVSLQRSDDWYRIVKDKSRLSALDLKHIDGSTATIPITAELFRQYMNINDREIKYYVDHNTTGPAYENLILGNYKKNIILVTEPSEDELAMAKEHNVELEVTPIALDGFVFITHKDNPVDSLTVEQIQGIYSGIITNWKALGGNDEEIKAYQREPNSGSQTVMENMVMNGIPMMDSPKISPPTTMGELVEAVADYKNKENSIGYTFYYYLNNLYKNEDIKVLKINGVSPDNENLLNKSYPFSSGYFAVTIKGKDKKAEEIKDYLISDEGQEIIKLAGYCPIR